MRVVIGRSNGDVIIGSHVRDTSLESSAHDEANRLLEIGEEPAKVGMPVILLPEGTMRDALPNEIQRYWRARVYENWQTTRARREAQRPAKRKTAKVSP